MLRSDGLSSALGVSSSCSRSHRVAVASALRLSLPEWAVPWRLNGRSSSVLTIEIADHDFHGRPACRAGRRLGLRLL